MKKGKQDVFKCRWNALIWKKRVFRTGKAFVPRLQVDADTILINDASSFLLLLLWMACLKLRHITCAVTFFFIWPSSCSSFDAVGSNRDCWQKNEARSKIDHYQKILNFFIICIKLDQKNYLQHLIFWQSFMQIR